MVLRRFAIPNQASARLAHTYTRPPQILPQTLVMLQKPTKLELGHGLFRTGRHGGICRVGPGRKEGFEFLVAVESWSDGAEIESEHGWSISFGERRRW